MAFKPLRKKRERGKAFPIGFIKRKIALILSTQFPKGIREPDLRDFLRENWGVSEPKGVKIHLAELKKKEMLVKEEKKFTNVWRLSESYEAFKSLLKEFHNSEDEIGFVRSKYAQSIINESFIDHFAGSWWRGYARFFKIQYPQKAKIIAKFRAEELRDEFYTGMLGTQKDDLIQIFRVSPTSLHIFLFPEEIFPSLNPGTPLDALFLFSFVADMSIYNVPEGKGISTRLEVEYGDVKKGEKGLKVSPSIKAKSQFGILNMKGVEK